MRNNYVQELEAYTTALRPRQGGWKLSQQGQSSYRGAY